MCGGGGGWDGTGENERESVKGSVEARPSSAALSCPVSAAVHCSHRSCRYVDYLSGASAPTSVEKVSRTGGPLIRCCLRCLQTTDYRVHLRSTQYVPGFLG